jgi:uncharacterized protein YjiS (DUF1127 family)
MTDMTSAGRMPVAGRLGIFSHLARTIRIHLEARRTVRVLQALDDHQLADIGLTRYEIGSRARNWASEALVDATRAL